LLAFITREDSKPGFQASVVGSLSHCQLLSELLT